MESSLSSSNSNHLQVNTKSKQSDVLLYTPQDGSSRERTLVLRTELNLNIQYRASWHTEHPTGRVLAPVDAAPEPGQILSFVLIEA